MNAPVSIAARAAPMALRTYEVWEQPGTGNKAVPLPLAASGLHDIERQIACDTYHGDNVYVVETDTIARTSVLHLYTVQKGGPVGWDAGGMRAYRYTAKRVLSLPIDAFVPTQPCRWITG